MRDEGGWIEEKRKGRREGGEKEKREGRKERGRETLLLDIAETRRKGRHITPAEP